MCDQPEDGHVESVCRKCGKVQRWETLVSIEYRKAQVSGNQSNLSQDIDHTDDPQLIAL
ncbi:hypothetical protein ACFLVR_02525 [Chloroflexota bacterium]